MIRLALVLVLLMAPGLAAQPNDLNGVHMDLVYVRDFADVWAAAETDGGSRSVVTGTGSVDCQIGGDALEDVLAPARSDPFPVLGSDGFKFRDSAEFAMCGLLSVTIASPHIRDEVRVLFKANRHYDEGGVDAYPAFAQEVRYQSVDGNARADPYFGPADDPHAEPKEVDVSVPATTQDVTISWWFADQGYGVVTNDPTSGTMSTYAYASHVTDIQFLLPGQAQTAPKWSEPAFLTAANVGGVHKATFDIPQPPDGFGARLEITSLDRMLLHRVIGPDGRVVDASLYDVDLRNRDAGSVIYPTAFDVHGHGTYQLQFTAPFEVSESRALAAVLSLVAIAQVTSMGLATSAYVNGRKFFALAGMNVGRVGIGTVLVSAAIGILLLTYLFATQSFVEAASLPPTVAGFIVFGFLLVSAASMVLAWQLMSNAEKVARHQIELERSNRELDEFSHIVTHDLRAPLRTVSTFAGLLQKKHGDKFDKEETEFVDLVTGGVARMSSLLDAVGHYSRVGSKKLLAQDVALHDVIAEVRRDLRRDLIDSGARIHAANLPTVHAEPALLRELLMNLIQNSIKFKHPDRQPVIQIRASMNAAGLLLTISDNGLGMTKTEIRHIFEPFQRGTASTNVPGTGMGLAVCRRIAERHGGKLDVDSTPGVGTTFILHLPDA